MDGQMNAPLVSLSRSFKFVFNSFNHQLASVINVKARVDG